MKYVADKKIRPVYLQLYNQIRDDIVNEVLTFNNKLPSIRVLAEETGVSTITVEHAYALLCDEGYIEPRERSGFTVSFRKKDGFATSASRVQERHAEYRTEHQHPDFPLSVLSKTMRRVLTERGELLLEKSENLGCGELRAAIKSYLCRNKGITVDAEQIVIGSGSEYLYGLIVELFGRNRSFAAENFAFIPKKIWTSAREEAFDLEHTTDFEAFASDIDSSAVALAEKNVKLAGVSDVVKVFRQDARKISADGRRGTIVTNPPYGERLGSLKEAEQLYRDIGVHFRSLAPWQVYVITSHQGFERLYGKKADKVRKLYNGMLPCYLYQYFKK